MSRRWIAVGLVAAALWYAPGVPASDEGEELPAFSAARLGDADAPEPGEEHYLSPAEREALAAQGYELEIDDTIVTQTRVQDPRNAHDEPKGKWGRAMDKMGKGMVAVASVVVPIAAAVAPFFLF